MAKVVRVLELYSGIGGMHSAIQACQIAYTVVAAYDVNTNANKIYQHNFLNTSVIDKGIEGLTVKAYDEMKIDMILMSPPCQPFTRVGNRQDVNDARTNSFLHVMDLLTRVSNPPNYLLVENVKGFEVSQARDKLVSTLKQCHYNFQELLLTPLQFGIPNSRLRYFLIAKKNPLTFGFPKSSEVQTLLPNCAIDWLVYRKQAEEETVSDELDRSQTDTKSHCLCGGYLGNKINTKETKLLSSMQQNNIADNESRVASVEGLESIPGENNVDKSNEGLCSENSFVEKVKCDSECDNSEIKPAKKRKLIIDEGENSLNIAPYTTGVSGLSKHSLSTTKSHIVCLEDYGLNMRQSQEKQPDYGQVLKLHGFLEGNKDTDTDRFTEFMLTEKDLKRFFVMDIVNPCSRKTTCFTKRYGRFMEGAGSLVQMTKDVHSVIEASQFRDTVSRQQSSDTWSPNMLSAIRNLKLRYFTPREIASLLGFPKDYEFPDCLTNRQKYMALGNSLNVHVVTVLIKLLTFNDDNLNPPVL